MNGTTDQGAIDAADLIDFSNLSEADGTGPLTPAGLDTSQPFTAAGGFFASVPWWAWAALAGVVVLRIVR